MDACVYLCMYVGVCVCVYVYIYMCVCVCVYVYVYMCTCMFLYMCVCSNMSHIYVMHIYMYVPIYMYIVCAPAFSYMLGLCASLGDERA